MPIYEYKCTICGEHFEVEQSIQANSRKTIKGDDHTHKVKKVFHAPGISFKGDGFYKNDARGKKSEKSESSSDKASETKSDSKSETKSDSKSETKSDSKSESKSSDKSSGSSSDSKSDSSPKKKEKSSS